MKKVVSILLLIVIAVGSAALSEAQVLLFVSEYYSGNVRGFHYGNGSEVTLPSGYSPVGGIVSGADGMVTDTLGRLYVNRGLGIISQRTLDGTSFVTFATLPGAPDPVFFSLDLTRDANYLYGSKFGSTTIYRTALSDGSVTTIAGPLTATSFDGVRIGPDGRLYAVDSTNGAIHAYDFSTSSWSLFLVNHLVGDASQMEFGSDGRVFLSRTIGGQAQIYSYTLNVPGNYASGLNSLSATLIGSYGSSGGATGIRIGPDGRLYANAFNAGEVWRSNVGITSMESSAFITGLNQPGSLYFAAIPEPSMVGLLLPAALVVWGFRRRV